jgi:diadenosine tetraphosphatase ApaH/serine/threonine PP2A family protein phosphatase
MKLALLSDVHANLQAFTACVAHARALGAERFALLGDLVGYGADPVPVLESVMHLAGEGAIVLKGNHDEMAVAPGSAGKTLGGSTADWTHAQLSAAHRDYLAALPLTHHDGPTLLVHASAEDPGRWRYVDDERSANASLDAAAKWPETRYVFGGHVHFQTLFYRGTGRGLMRFSPTAGVPVPMPRHRHWVATVGSVGQPRDGDPRAMYAIFDTTMAQVTFHRVAYDHHAAAAAIRRAGLPEYFAKRLEDGR